MTPAKANFSKASKLAVENIIRHGDTDIFPFPIEHHAFFDNRDKFISLIEEYDKNYQEYLAIYSPSNISSLTPVSYSGFRWATQMSPIWNAVFLSWVLSIATQAEKVRVDKKKEIVFSYRYSPDKDGNLFEKDLGWKSFMQKSLDLSEKFDFVVCCDISEFYPRLSHHRLENALLHVGGDSQFPKKIMSYLGNFSNTRSFSLPIGGPAARILSELTINQIDHLLLGETITFTRFADDYHLFANSKEEAYRNLVYISEKLFDNQGLSLQKSKTRILTASEFKSTAPVILVNEEDPEEDGQKVALSRSAQVRRELLNFSLKFDPYSATAEDDYEQLRSEIRKFDVIGLLKDELSKSRIHTALARKIVGAIRYLDGRYKDDAVLSILNNCDVLYPIFSSILLMIDKIFEELEEETKTEVISELVSLIQNDSHIMRIDVHLSYALRVLAKSKSEENQFLLQKIYKNRTSPIIRRDIILTLAKWQDWYWLSDLITNFKILSNAERRALLIASYTLKDEGKHWREHIKNTLDPFENYILEWAGKKSNDRKWTIPV